MAVAMSAVTKVPVLIRVETSMYVDVMLGGKTVKVELCSPSRNRKIKGSL